MSPPPFGAADEWLSHRHCGADLVGSNRVEAIVALERALRATHAEIARRPPAPWCGSWSRSDRLRARGDERNRGQVMVNTLFERATGIETMAGPEIELSIVLPVEALQGQPVPADVAGHGPITPHLAAQIVDGADQAWFRRLFTDPTGSLAGLDPRRRCFTGNLASWIRTRDGHQCQQPGNGAIAQGA